VVDKVAGRDEGKAPEIEKGKGKEERRGKVRRKVRKKEREEGKEERRGERRGERRKKDGET
jgi:hypothetical protein